MRAMLLEKLFGMLVLSSCMLWAAAEKPYHDRVGGDPSKPDCNGTYYGVSCTVDQQYNELLNPQCHEEDQEFIESTTIKIRVEANDFACTGILYKGYSYRHCTPHVKKRADDYCNKK